MVDTYTQTSRAHTDFLEARVSDVDKHTAPVFIANLLSSKPFGKKQFKDMADYARRFYDSGIVLCQKSQQKKERLLNVSFDWMQATTGHVSYISDRLLTPTSFHLEMDKKSFFHVERLFPIIWDYDHVEFRQMQRARMLPEYDDADFMQTLKIGLAFSNYLNVDMPQQGNGAVPIFLPHKKGVFCGLCVLQSPQASYPLTYIKNEFSRSGQNILVNHGAQDRFKPSWGSGAIVVIKTFIPTTQLFTLKSNLYDKMQTMLEDKAFNKNIDVLWQKYRRAEYFSSQEWPCVQSANDDIRSVLQSKEWAQAVASREGKISYINADPFADLKPNAL